MRPTVTFGDDVAAAVEQRRRERETGFSEVEPLAHDFGRMLIDVTDIAAAISLADGDAHR